MSKRPDLIVTAGVAAGCLGLSRRQFDRLARAGILAACAPRRFDLAQVVPAFIEYVSQGREGISSLADAKLRTETEKGRALAFANEIRAGRLVYADHVGELLSTVAADLVQQLEAVPGRHADELAALAGDGPGVMRAKLLEIMRGLRTNFANDAARAADELAAKHGP